MFYLPDIYQNSALIMALMAFSAILLYKHFNNKLMAQALLFFVQVALINSFAYLTQSHSWSLIIWSFLVFHTANTVTKFIIPLIGFASNIAVISYFCHEGVLYDDFLYKEVHFIGNVLFPSILYIILMNYKRILDIAKYNELKLQQQKDTISKMIITLSHEINNPLAITKMCLTRLEHDYSRPLIERCENNIDRIIEINRLIKDLQDFDEIKYGETSKMYNIFKKVEIDNNGRFKRREGELLN